MSNLPIQTYESVVQQRDELEKKLVAVVAENAELKKFGDTLFEMSKSLNGTGVCIQGNYEVACQQLGIDAAIDAFDKIETPVTDAFTRELMAKGVDALAVKYRNMIETMHPDTIAYGALKQEFESVIKEANKFADQRRKGINDAP